MLKEMKSHFFGNLIDIVYLDLSLLTSIIKIHLKRLNPPITKQGTWPPDARSVITAYTRQTERLIRIQSGRIFQGSRDY